MSCLREKEKKERKSRGVALTVGLALRTGKRAGTRASAF
jgi:hypothetical protein